MQLLANAAFKDLTHTGTDFALKPTHPLLLQSADDESIHRWGGNNNRAYLLWVQRLTVSKSLGACTKSKDYSGQTPGKSWSSGKTDEWGRQQGNSTPSLRGRGSERGRQKQGDQMCCLGLHQAALVVLVMSLVLTARAVWVPLYSIWNSHHHLPVQMGRNIGHGQAVKMNSQERETATSPHLSCFLIQADE